MQVEPTPQPSVKSQKPPPSAAGHYCECALPLPIERAERRGAAHTACARCDLPIPVRWGRRSW